MVLGRKVEYNKRGFGGLSCEWCGEPIRKTDLAASEDVGYCPQCGHFTSTERQTVRMRSLRDLLARPPETIRDEGTVDGERRIDIGHPPIRRLLPSFFCWLFGVLAAEVALAYFFKCGYEMQFAEAEFCRWSEQRVAADRPKGAKETVREITWRPTILNCPSGFVLLICLWGGMWICQILKVDGLIGLLSLSLLLALYVVLRKSCRYCLWLTDDELVFTRRFFCFRREVRVPRAGALAIGATRKKLPAVAVLLPDGTSRRLLSDLPVQTARWLIAWLNERLVCRWKRDRD